MAPIENFHDYCGCYDTLLHSYCPPRILGPSASLGPPSPTAFLAQEPWGRIPCLWGTRERWPRGKDPGGMGDGEARLGNQCPWVLQGAAQVLSLLTLAHVRPRVTKRMHSFPAWKILTKRRGF